MHLLCATLFRPRSISPLHLISQVSRRPYSASVRPLRVLGLESSADDACAAIVTSDRRILSNVVCKQHDINAQYGGIHPIKAQEAHMRDMPGAISRALKNAQLGFDDIDAIAYTRGPGMYGCLSVAATSAKALAAALDVPIVGVHHMQAHALTPLLTEEVPPSYPFLTLLVSGGHSMLVLAQSQSKFKIVMTTLDNSIGDVIDKAARLLRLPSTGTSQGAALEHYASLPPLPPFDQSQLKPLKLPLSTNTSTTTLAFSFGGVLSSFQQQFQRYSSRSQKENPTRVVDLKQGRGLDEGIQREMSRVFQEAAVRHLVDKVQLAMESLKVDVKGLVVSGGVASNRYLRSELQHSLGNDVKLYYPPVELCTDNAVMIAWTGILRLLDRPHGDGFDLPIRKKWSLEDLYDDVPDE